MQTQTERTGIDFQKALSNVFEGRWVIALTTLVFTLAGVMYALTATPIYKADALIQVEEKKNGMPGMGDMSEMFNVESASVTEIELIKSRSVIGKAVEKLNLDIKVQPHYFPLIGQTLARRHSSEELAQSWFGLDQYAWGGEVLNVSSLDVSRHVAGEELELLVESPERFSIWISGEKLLSGKVGERAEDAAGRVSIVVTNMLASQGTRFSVMKERRELSVRDLQNGLSVSERGKKSGILRLSLYGSDPVRIVQTLDAIANYYHLQNVQRHAAEAEKSLEFLRQQLPDLKMELTEAEERLNEYKLANRSVDLSLETQSVLEQIVNLETRLSELAFIEADLARRYTPEHPNYVAFERKKTDLEGERERLTSEIQELPETQQEVLRLTRDLEVSQQIYLTLQNKAQELNVAKAGTVGNVRIIDAAEATVFPVKPKKSLIVVLATFIGGLISVAAVLVRAQMNQGVENQDDFEQIGLSVYGSIPLSSDYARESRALRNRKGSAGHPDKSLLLAESNQADLAVEALRSLRTSLHFAISDAPNNLLMISGPSPEVGKSFVSSNLAVVFAQMGKKVLLVDTDMRKGYLPRVFRLGNEVGLSELLNGDVSAADAVQSTEVAGLDFISRGKVPPNPSELLMRPTLKACLDKFSEDYDLVILDTPPILAVTDPTIVGKLAGVSLMVSRFAQNPLKEVDYATKRFAQNGIEIKGVIFNGVEKRAVGYDYGYYNYEYKTDS